MSAEITAQKTAVVDPATGLFCEDGLADGRIVVAVAENPDPKLHRYSGDPQAPVRSATDAEIAAQAAAQADARAAREFGELRAVRALALVVGDLAGKTGAQMAALVRAELKAIP